MLRLHSSPFALLLAGFLSAACGGSGGGGATSPDGGADAPGFSGAASSNATGQPFGGGSSGASTSDGHAGASGSGSGSGSTPPPACTVTGLASVAASFGLPAGDYSGGTPPAGGTASPIFSSIDGASAYCQESANRPVYAVVDMNGDQRPDLVVTYDCLDSTVGNTHWAVYLNTGSGFSSTATSFGLPKGDYSGGTPPVGGTASPVFSSIDGGSAYCQESANRPVYSLVDMNGDQKPDLVVTYDCLDSTVGNTHWAVYLNTGSGFSSTASSFGLPQGDYSGGTPPAGGTASPVFSAIDVASAYCQDSANRPVYSLVDMNGDQKPDLVVTYDCLDSTVGNTHWAVYLNTGSGFASTASSFGLPKGDYSGGTPPAGGTASPVFSSIDVASAYCQESANRPIYSLVDVNGDQKPDLVVTYDCLDSTVGNTHWAVYPNTGSGFASTASSFGLPKGDYSSGSPPAGGTASPIFSSIDGASAYCQESANRPVYSFVDVTGDQKPDLVVTYDCLDSTVGNTHWAVYVNTGSGLAATATSFGLPTGDYSSGSPPAGGTASPVFSSVDGYSAYCQESANRPVYALVDLAGKAKPDLVVTYDCLDASVGNTHWALYAGECQ